MDYNFFTTEPAAQQFPVFNFGTDLSTLPQSIENDAHFQVPAMGSSLPQHTYDYKFDTSLSQDAILPMQVPTQSSPTAHQLSILPNTSVDSGIDMDQDMPPGRRGSSEEKDSLTPSQSRRKAQNRAAQRAFRERKERHVRDLEAKLTLLTTTTSSLQSDNERLKVMLQKAKAENELLRASAATSPIAAQSQQDENNALSRSWSGHSSVSEDASLDAISAAAAASSISSSSSPDKSISPSQSTLLSASATWDLIQSHPRYTAGSVDITKVYERLRKLARTNGSGPMFDEDEVRKVIDEVGGNGADELI